MKAFRFKMNRINKLGETVESVCNSHRDIVLSVQVMVPSRLPYLILSLIVLIASASCSSLSGGHAAATPAQSISSLLAPNTEGTSTAEASQSQDPVIAADTEDAPDVQDQQSSDEGVDNSAPADENGLDAALELIDSSQEYWNDGDRDRAVDALDQAYAILLNVPADAGAKELQQKEDLRFMIAKRLTEIYASRFTTVKGNGKEIPLTMNDHVEREIQLFQNQERDFFLESYKRSGRYHDEIAKAFREAGMPEELAWLPMIESGFKVRALSRARALGLWQFIPSTGYKFGLKRNMWVDERLDPEKATQAAIAYLRELHQIFGDWATVLAAYNCGEGNVLRVIRQQKINYLDNFWDLYERLPSETARYYPRFLAVLAILKDPAKYGFTLEDPDKPLPFDVIDVEKPIQLSKLAEKVGCSIDDLRALNPELRHEATPKGSYDLKVPQGMKEAALACLDSLPAWSPPKPAYVVHRVRRGETLSTIAVRYRTSIRRIMEANNLHSVRFIRAGQRLKIPVRDTS